MLTACLMGTVLGFLSGLGTGGGSLLILWLTLGLQMEQQTARAINLMFFLPSALIACLFRRKQGKLDIRRILPAIVSGCASAAVFSLVSAQLDMQLLRKLFGGLLLVTGTRELLYRARNAK